MLRVGNALYVSFYILFSPSLLNSTIHDAILAKALKIILSLIILPFHHLMKSCTEHLLFNSPDSTNQSAEHTFSSTNSRVQYSEQPIIFISATFEQQLTYNTLLITQPKSDFRADDRLTQGSEIVKLTKEEIKY